MVLFNLSKPILSFFTITFQLRYYMNTIYYIACFYKTKRYFLEEASANT